MASPAIDEILRELRDALARERQALLERDWGALSEATRLKDALAQDLLELPQTSPPAAAKLLDRVVSAAEHNSSLALRLSEELAELLQLRLGSAPTYTRNARLPRHHVANMSRVG